MIYDTMITYFIKNVYKIQKKVEKIKKVVDKYKNRVYNIYVASKSYPLFTLTKKEKVK